VEIKYSVQYTKKAIKDIQKLKTTKFFNKVEQLCAILANDPTPLKSKELLGDLEGQRSIRINLKHRIVYEVYKKEKIVKILSMWGHYE